jgi:hypothetical protein
MQFHTNPEQIFVADDRPGRPCGLRKIWGVATPKAALLKPHCARFQQAVFLCAYFLPILLMPIPD